MIIYNLDIKTVPVFPAKAYSPLPVDSNAVSTDSIALQRFKSIRWWNSQILKTRRVVEHPELSPCLFL
jgi:hypothetical protein